MNRTCWSQTLSKWPFCGHANFWQLTLNSDGFEKNGPALLPSGWLPVAIIPSQQGDENVVLVGPLEWVAYFRLHKPD